MTNSAEYKAIVWDMDGMLIDTESISLVAWRDGCQALGHEVDEESFLPIIGMNRASMTAKLEQTLSPEIDVEQLIRRASLCYEKLIRQGVPLKPGARDCLLRMRELGTPQALATSSSQRFATLKLDHHGLLDCFAALVTGDQVTNGKPHPEPYLTAAARLEVAPSSCIAFEDSVNGIQSAHTAGMFTALVPDLAPHDAVSMSRVSRTFDSLEEALPWLESVFAR